MFNEEIPVNEWLKEIKYVKLGRNDVYSDYKELKFWVTLTKVLIVFTLHPAHWKAAERPKGSTLLH